MKRATLAVVLLQAVVLVASASVALAAGRVALVVNNGSYAHMGRLPNPGNDAADMTAALRGLGFEVTLRDADRTAMTEALRVFTRESAGADLSLVFYAGHGLEMDGVNYLVPVDARLERDTDVRFEAVELDYVLGATAGGRPPGGDPGCVPEQPARPVDAAYEGVAERESEELWGPGRVAAAGRGSTACPGTGPVPLRGNRYRLFRGGEAGHQRRGITDLRLGLSPK